MKSVDVTITGVTPLLMHRMPLEPVEAIEKKTPDEQAEISAYRLNGPTSNLYLPGVNLWRSLIAGAAYSKGKGRASLQRNAAAGLFVTPERLDLGLATYRVDSRAVVVPATKGRVIRHRPVIDQWRVSFTLEYDETLLSDRQVRQIVDDAGSRVGVLDYRPEKKGPFGRFRVDGWAG